MRDPDYVVGEIKLTLIRSIGAQLGYLGMQLRIPFASWLYFRSVLGSGVDFTIKEINIDE